MTNLYYIRVPLQNHVLSELVDVDLTITGEPTTKDIVAVCLSVASLCRV
jgi:coenzyme F420-reducing hydrogenase gamma subunit